MIHRLNFVKSDLPAGREFAEIVSLPGRSAAAGRPIVFLREIPGKSGLFSLVGG